MGKVKYGTNANGAQGNKKQWITISVLVTICLVVIILIVKPSPSKPKPSRLNIENDFFYDELKKPANSLHSLPSNSKVDAKQIQQRASTLHKLRQSLLLPANIERTHEIVDRCQDLSQHDQLLDTECTAVWLNALRHDEIVAVDRWWGFEETHFGAITVKLANGMKAMFKPCSSPSEDTTKEVIASNLDQLLQWGQTAPVITRRIPVSLLEAFVTNFYDRRTFNETMVCAQGNDFVGPMIGWWDSLIPIRTMNKKDLDLPTLFAKRYELGKNLLTTQMQSKYHVFYMLVYILRHGKDEFITKSGDLVSLDLDRSRYQSTTSLTSQKVNFTWCYTCYMDRWVYDTFQAVGPKQPQHLRLGYLMKDMLSFEDIFGQLWDTRLAEALDTRVSMLLKCIDDCILRLGEGNVLLDQEKSQMTNRELVQWFVDNSEYKNMNGKRGPTDPNFVAKLFDVEEPENQK